MIDKQESDYKNRQEILELLKNNSGIPFTAKTIAEKLNLPSGNTQREIRQAITDLLEIDGEPVVSNAKGFLYAVNHHQVSFYARELEDRMAGLQRRVDCVRRIANKMVSGDPEITVFENPTVRVLKTEIRRVKKVVSLEGDVESLMLVKMAESAIKNGDSDVVLMGYLFKLEKLH